MHGLLGAVSAIRDDPTSHRAVYSLAFKYSLSTVKSKTLKDGKYSTAMGKENGGSTETHRQALPHLLDKHQPGLLIHQIQSTYV